MRWLIAIAVLAVIGIAGMVYVGTKPRKATVDWHKREYENYMQCLAGKRTLLDRIRSVFGLANRPDRHMEHRRALIDLGYLEEREIILTNNPEGFSQALVQWATNEFPQSWLWSFGVRSKASCFFGRSVTTWKKWEEAVRRIDVPRKSH
jgi:hypothetical protein